MWPRLGDAEFHGLVLSAEALADFVSGNSKKMSSVLAEPTASVMRDLPGDDFSLDLLGDTLGAPLRGGIAFGGDNAMVGLRMDLY